MNFSFIHWMILLFLIVLATPLFKAWLIFSLFWPLSLSFLIWISPLFYLHYFLKLKLFISPLLLNLSLTFAFLGILGDLNSLKYLALAIYLTSLIPFSPYHLIWILSSLSWMPALSWITAKHFSFFPLISFGLASLSLGMLFSLSKRS